MRRQHHRFVAAKLGWSREPVCSIRFTQLIAADSLTSKSDRRATPAHSLNEHSVDHALPQVLRICHPCWSPPSQQVELV